MIRLLDIRGHDLISRSDRVLTLEGLHKRTKLALYPIFLTPEYRQRYEARARTNLQSELATLSDNLP